MISHTGAMLFLTEAMPGVSARIFSGEATLPHEERDSG